MTTRTVDWQLETTVQSWRNLVKTYYRNNTLDMTRPRIFKKRRERTKAKSDFVTKTPGDRPSFARQSTLLLIKVKSELGFWKYCRATGWLVENSAKYILNFYWPRTSTMVDSVPLPQALSVFLSMYRYLAPHSGDQQDTTIAMRSTAVPIRPSFCLKKIRQVLMEKSKAFLTFA